ncbi:MAG: hypothetical protein KDC46_05740 [Thermoleophilia bacterium]|nr:hypothetical protein [Thermoleophilia bacterium]
MNGDDTTPDPEAAKTPAEIDPAALKDAHGRTGRMFKAAGLPFEEDEFDDDDSTSSSSEDGDSSSSSDDDAAASTDA